MWRDELSRQWVCQARQERLRNLDKRDKSALAGYENDFMGTGFSTNSNPPGKRAA